VFCDVVAFACADLAGSSAKPDCKAATPAPLLVSAPGLGNSVCVEHDSMTAVAACNTECARLGKPYYPQGSEGCVATVNTDSAHAYDSAQFVRNACVMSGALKPAGQLATFPEHARGPAWWYGHRVVRWLLAKCGRDCGLHQHCSSENVVSIG
jgi:hypothetical protein